MTLTGSCQRKGHRYNGRQVTAPGSLIFSGVKVDASNCSALSVTAYALPDLGTEWTDPAIGTEPVVTIAPAVIGGVVQ